MRLQRTVPVLPRGFVVEHQKRRAAEALAELCQERKPDDVTVTMVCKQAQMSRTTFYGHFAGIAGCGMYTNDDSFKRTCGSLLREPELEDPTAQLQSTLASLFADLASQPALAEFCLVHSLSVSRKPGESSHEMAVDAVQSRIATFFNAAAAPARAPSSPILSEALARALLRQSARKLRRREAHRLLGLESSWVRLIGSYLPSAALAQALSSSSE